MTTEFPSINKSENEKIENCMNSLLLNSTELELEKSKGKSKESAYKVDETDAHAHADADEHADGDGDDDGERIDGPINRIAIYQTLVVNNKEIAIYQYKAFPKIYLNSVYELLSSELSEPYNIFLLKTILKNYDEIALMVRKA
ncbi:acetyltransferase, putative [Plasmodium ovale wallikeri]|uniref:Acetyltransferase, putative n=1 Tax=Plasmodium ovale wallikeri TaxID=864142 RepID=A0A1A8YHI5_PLAOA|nr:acetyltransferase, putative [Plasmodium ovale wallikeri]SBT31011.1 acetyltransferase, putative [Plasmodium ovale wallikeri]